jgi:hypothetical protein
VDSGSEEILAKYLFSAVDLWNQGIDLKSAHAYGELALSMVDQLGTKDVEARTVFIAHFVLHWRDPLQQGLRAYHCYLFCRCFLTNTI